MTSIQTPIPWDQKLDADDIRQYHRESSDWHQCAIGEVLGYPEHNKSPYLYNFLDERHPKLHRLGHRFNRQVKGNKPWHAKKTLEEIREYSKENNLKLEDYYDFVRGTWMAPGYDWTARWRK